MERPTPPSSDKPTPPAIPQALPKTPEPPSQFLLPDDAELNEETLEAFFELVNDRNFTTPLLMSFKQRISDLLQERNQLQITVQESQQLLSEKDDELRGFQSELEQTKAHLAEKDGQLTALREEFEKAKSSVQPADKNGEHISQQPELEQARPQGATLHNLKAYALPGRKAGMYGAAAALLLVLGGAGGRTFFGTGKSPEPVEPVPTPVAQEPEVQRPETEASPVIPELPAVDVKALIERSVAENQEVSGLLQSAANGQALTHYQLDRIRTFHELAIDRARQQFERNMLETRQSFDQTKKSERETFIRAVDERRAEFNKQVDEIRTMIRGLSRR